MEEETLLPKQHDLIESDVSRCPLKLNSHFLRFESQTQFLESTYLGEMCCLSSAWTPTTMPVMDKAESKVGGNDLDNEKVEVVSYLPYFEEVVETVAKKTDPKSETKPWRRGCVDVDSDEEKEGKCEGKLVSEDKMGKLSTFDKTSEDRQSDWKRFRQEK
jgi:hypothetical protein